MNRTALLVLCAIVSALLLTMPRLRTVLVIAGAGVAAVLAFGPLLLHLGGAR